MAFSTLATCNLNQWSLDYDGNLRRIQESIREAKRCNAKYRVGPELEITGYGCEDHFYEHDTYKNALHSLRLLLESDASEGLAVDIGMPIMHRGVRYNCRVILLNKKVVMIRPKVFLADDGNYRESRWFTAWTGTGKGEYPYFSLEEWTVPEEISSVTGQTRVPFGVAILESEDGVTVAPETCEELFTPASPHIPLSLAGCDVFVNGSGSHHQLRKLHTRVDLMREATAKSGGVYVYANQQGCDGGRLYYDGCSMIMVNGACVAQATQFSVTDVEVVCATVDLEDVRSARAATVSRGFQSQMTGMASKIPRVSLPGYRMGVPRSTRVVATPPRPVFYHSPAEEIGLGPACWMWDYLRRAGGQGFMLPLSGGADSAATATMVGIMCHLVVQAYKHGDAQVIADVAKVTKDPAFIPSTPADLANKVLHTCYMGTGNSGTSTRDFAAGLQQQIGGFHCYALIDVMVKAVLWVVCSFVFNGKQPRFKAEGGTMTEDLALQNIQARLRMVLSYVLAQLLPWVRGKDGFLLVLGSANVDESLRGYMTKYDCSSADLNPIGAMSKADLRMFLLDAATRYNYTVLVDIVTAVPTAELRPIAANPFTLDKDANGRVVMRAEGFDPSTLQHGPAGQQGGEDAPRMNSTAVSTQRDEDEMGMTYEELSWFGRLRKQARCGPWSMYCKLVACNEKPWAGLARAEVAAKVKRFFLFYSMNRHKLTTLTPSYHAESYSPDDNRFDHRPFLYPIHWSRDAQCIDEDVALYSSLPAGSAVVSSVALAAKGNGM